MRATYLYTFLTAQGSLSLDEWRPRRGAEQVLTDIHEWIAADEARIAEALNIEAPVGGRE